MEATQQQFEVVVEREHEYGNRTYESAARFTLHRLKPGRYPVQAIRERGFAGRFHAMIDATTTVDTYHGITSPSFAPREEPLYWSFYEYELVDGKEMFGGAARLQVIA